MKRIFILFCYVSYSSSQIFSMNKAPVESLCDNPNAKTARLEQIFNTIFAEFNTPPPACVCVQLCTGEFTYCYPSGCLNRHTAVTASTEKEVPAKTIVKTTPPQMQRSKSQFMLVKDDKYDFMTDFLERNYLDQLKASPRIDNPIEDLRPDPFKDKYSILGKYRKVPKVELRYNIHEKVKNAKSDMIKVEGWIKPKWARNKNKKLNNEWFSDVDKPLKDHSAFFRTMLSDKEVAEYPPKYFKRDLKKIIEDDDSNVLKAFYVLDNFNTTDSDSLSFETLINNLIDNSIVTTTDDDTTKFPISKRDKDNDTNVAIENDVSKNSMEHFNETTRVISLNFTNESIDKNKDADDNLLMNKTANINEMILHLEKQIEIQNNTSMEIARRVLSNVTEDMFKTSKDVQLNASLFSSEFNTSSTVYKPSKLENTTFTTDTEIETTTVQEVLVTKKNRQRLVKKYANAKVN